MSSRQTAVSQTSPVLTELVLRGLVDEIGCKIIPMGGDDGVQLDLGVVPENASPQDLVGVQRIVREALPLVDAEGGEARLWVAVGVTKKVSAGEATIARGVVGHGYDTLVNRRAVRLEQTIVRYEGIRIGEVV